MDKNQINTIESILKESLRYKFQNYNPEPAVKPFHTRLLGKDRLALYSFIQSLLSSFGTSFYEPVAKEIGSVHFQFAYLHQVSGNRISSEAHKVIQTIMDKLSVASTTPNKPYEIEAIRKVCTLGEMTDVKPTKIDLKLVSKKGTIYLIDLKTVKPNSGEFKGYKRTLLEWVAVTLATNPKADVQTLLAIPYNPYEPEPYNRWTIRGMLDLEYELKVAEEFWDFLGGDGAYQDLLDIFERVGIELRPEIDDYFARFNKT
ncbi:MAG: TdeIII family type II restriction endonuclease [Candidatus Cloacimonetes bacterium]|nr:TdeIII family type II restriction endonuclease [Candidatus Cloacimonadota bacterium]